MRIPRQYKYAGKVLLQCAAIGWGAWFCWGRFQQPPDYFIDPSTPTSSPALHRMTDMKQWQKHLKSIRRKQSTFFQYAECDLSNGDLHNAILRNDEFKACAFSQTNLQKAEVNRCHLMQCNCDQADFGGATISDTVFEGCSFKNAKFKNVTIGDGVIFTNCDLRDCDFGSAVFGPGAITFHHCDLRKASFANVISSEHTAYDWTGNSVFEMTATGWAFPLYCLSIDNLFGVAYLWSKGGLRVDTLQKKWDPAAPRPRSVRALFENLLQPYSIEELNNDLHHRLRRHREITV